MNRRANIEREPSLPEYVSTSVGAVDLSNLANRLRDMAALMAASGLEDVAEHLAKAAGALRAKIAASGDGKATPKEA